MVIIVPFITGVLGLIAGVVFAGIWWSAAALFGYPLPTELQFQGLCFLVSGLSCVGGGALAIFGAIFWS